MLAVLSFGHVNTSPNADYTLNGSSLKQVSEAKYLGVILKPNLKFTNHIRTKIVKARRQLGLNKRAPHNAPTDARLLAYTSLCRPHIEYATFVWDTSY